MSATAAWLPTASPSRRPTLTTCRRSRRTRPAWVTLVDLRFGIARHFGLNEETADVYFDTWRHDEVADWCKTVGQRPPAPDGALKGIHTYGVTYNRHTKAIGKVKVYKWSKNFVDGIMDLHPKATRWMLQKWSKQTLSLT